MVQTDDSLKQLLSLYYQMYCDQRVLDQTAGSAEKHDLSDSIEQLSDQLTPKIQQAITQVSDAKAKNAFRAIRVSELLIAAEVSRANKDPGRVVRLLQHFENEVSGFPQEQQNEMLGKALFLRVNAYLTLGKSGEALAEVKTLIQKDSPEALSTVNSLVQQINASFNVERGKDHPDQIALDLLSEQRAQFSALLVEQVKRDPSMPAEKRRQYLEFNARAQLQAARLQTDFAKRRDFLDQAMKTFQGMITETKPDDPGYPALQRDIALTEFELGDPENLQKAHDTLNDLFAEKKFGLPLMRVGDESRSNDAYWEGLLRLLQAKVRLAEIHHDPALRDEAGRILKNHLIQFGDQAGGDAYAKDFRALRKDLLGDWTPASATTNPATRP
jgi:hypothetical protein